MRKSLKTRKLVRAFFVGACSFGVVSAVAQGNSDAADVLDPVLVSGAIVGSKEGVNLITGSATYLDIDDLRVHSISDINSALRRVPGVYVRPEDGYGNFPNISLRGIDMGRSSKVTIMEDGILAAPAPYSAPSAYYSPTLERMSGLEVIKGSSQVKYGPHTTGGAINYLSGKGCNVFSFLPYNAGGDGDNVWPFVERGKLRPAMDRTFPLELASAAHARMEAGDHVGKIVLVVSSSV